MRRVVAIEFKRFSVANQYSIVKNSPVAGVPPAVPLLKFIIRKSVQGVLLLFVVSAISFALLSRAGGDAFSSLRDNPQISAETIESLRETYGLDRPAAARYLNWLGDALRGDMGESFSFRTPVRGLVLGRLWNTLQIGGLGLLFAVGLSALLAFLSVRHPRRVVRRVNEAVVLLAASTPRIVLSLAALLLAVTLARRGAAIAPGSWPLLLLASVVLGSPLVAIFLAQMQEGLRGAMREPFVQFARAKGLSETAVILRHASRAALNPVLSLLGMSLGSIVGGSVIVETVLGWPGVGALMVGAIRGRDVPLVMGIVVLASAAVWFGNAAAELLQMLNDKRMREAEEN